MTARRARRWVAAVVVLLAACDGAADPGEPARFSVRITTAAVVNESVPPSTPVLLTAEGAAVGGAPVTDASRYEWRVRSGAPQRGNAVSVVLVPGANPVTVTLTDEAGQVVARDSTVITVPRDTVAVRINVACTPGLLRGGALPAGCLSTSIIHNPRSYTPEIRWRLDAQNEVASPEQLALPAAAVGDRRVYVLVRIPGQVWVSDSVRVAVRDTLHVAGYVWGLTPAGAVPAPGWRVHARVGGVEDSAPVAADGSFALTSRGVITDLAEVWVDTAAGGVRTYHPAWMRLSEAQARQAVRVMLVPRAWTIPRGTFAGTTVPVSLDVLLRRAGVTSDLTYYPREAVSWDPARYPIPAAIANDSSNLDLAADDSARVWLGIEALMAADGVRYFAPGRPDVPGPGRVLLWIKEGMNSLGAARANPPVPGDGFLTEGRVWFLNHQAASATIAEHEFRHVLGVGHTCFFPSIMRAIGTCPAGEFPVSISGTQWDVAYMQLLHAMHAEQRRLDARHGIGAGTAGERILMLGQPALRVMTDLSRVPVPGAHFFHRSH